MKVAQYEVLGNNEKNVRPGRDDRSVLAPGPLVCGFTSISSRRSSRPGRVFFLNATPALRAGLLSLSPSGTTPLGAYPSCYVDAHRRPQDRVVSKTLPFSGSRR